MARRHDQNVMVSEIMQSLRRIFRAIHDYSNEVSDKFGITGPQLWALKTLSQYGSLSQGQLSEKMYLHPSTITGLVDRLERKGYAERDRNQKDRRVVKVQLTTKGKTLAKATPNPIHGKMIYGLRNCKKKELSSIYDSVQRLMTIMEAQNVKATFFFDDE
jgi:MarR family transcriptional regulator, organic hydroperoxide resistance regulator